MTETKKTPSWPQIIQWMIIVFGIGSAIGMSKLQSVNHEKRIESLEKKQDTQNYELILYRLDETNNKIDGLTDIINDFVLER